MFNKSSLKAVLLLSLALVITGCGMKPEASVSGVKLGKFSAQAATLIFDVDIKNPYQMPLPLTGLDYALSTEGTKFLSGTSDSQGLVPAGESKTIQLPVEVPFRELFTTVKSARGKKEIPYTADLGLFVNTPLINKKMRLPMQKDGVLKLPSITDIMDKAGNLRDLRDKIPGGILDR